MPTFTQNVAFGSSKAGLTTIGYRLIAQDGTISDRVATGIIDLGDGEYGASVVFPDGFRGWLKWDTGEPVPRYATVAINPEDSAVEDDINAKIDVLQASIVPRPQGAVIVDHNYNGPDSLAYKTAGGTGVAGGTIVAYLSTDYAAGNFDNTFVKGRSFTAAEGRWQYPMFLQPGTYTLVFGIPGLYGPNVATVTVS